MQCLPILNWFLQENVQKKLMHAAINALQISNCVIIKHGFGGFPDLWQVKVLPDNFVLILFHRSILTSSNKLARKEKKRTQQEIIYFVYKKLITYGFKIIKEKIIQSCFKTFMERIEFKFVLFLFYPTPMYLHFYIIFGAFI